MAQRLITRRPTATINIKAIPDKFHNDHHIGAWDNEGMLTRSLSMPTTMVNMENALINKGVFEADVSIVFMGFIYYSND